MQAWRAAVRRALSNTPFSSHIVHSSKEGVTRRFTTNLCADFNASLPACAKQLTTLWHPGADRNNDSRNTGTSTGGEAKCAMCNMRLIQAPYMKTSFVRVAGVVFDMQKFSLSTVSLACAASLRRSTAAPVASGINGQFGAASTRIPH